MFRLPYSGSLYKKALVIKDKYLGREVKYGEPVLISVASLDLRLQWADIDSFMQAVLPIGKPLVHFSRDGSPLDPSVIRPTHEFKQTMTKPNGSSVNKEFLTHGSEFPYVSGVIFSEISEVRFLLGEWSSSFDGSTRELHVMDNYKAAVKVPAEFTRPFYHHYFSQEGVFTMTVPGGKSG